VYGNVDHPAFANLSERVNEVLDHITANQQRYLDDDGKMCPVVIALARQKVEETDAGQLVAAINPDRRIYAVLKPTPAEDLHRTKVVFDCSREVMSPQEYEHFCLSLSGGYLAIRIAQKYDEGQISYEVARELIDQVFPPDQD